MVDGTSCCKKRRPKCDLDSALNSTPAFGSDDAVEHSSKDGGDFDFDGLLLRISGVRLREAQTEKVQVCLASSFQWFLKLGMSRFLYSIHQNSGVL